MNDVVPKKSALGVNVTCCPSVAVDPAPAAPADVTVSPWPNGSMSLPSTDTVTAWPWFVVAESGWACGGGADGGVIVSDTVPVSDGARGVGDGELEGVGAIGLVDPRRRLHRGPGLAQLARRPRRGP